MITDSDNLRRLERTDSLEISSEMYVDQIYSSYGWECSGVDLWYRKPYRLSFISWYDPKYSITE